MSIGHRKDIQGLRAFAITAVFFYHIFYSGVPNAFLGVDMFFIISGFLITSILKEKYSENTYWTTFKAFYFGRFRRIVPLAITVLLINFLAVFLIHPTLKTWAVELSKEVILAAAFTANLVHLLFEPDFFSEKQWPIFLIHYWSLAAEMQFYIIAPLLISFIVRCKKVFISLAITCVVFFSSLIWYSKTEYFAAYCWTHLRLWQFMMGTLTYICILCLKKKRKLNAMLLTQNTLPTHSCCDTKKVLIVSNLLSICLLVVILNPANFFLTKFLLYENLSLTLSVFFTSSIIVLNSFVNEDEQDRLLLSQRFLVAIGDLSYPIYLVHYPIISHYKLLFEIKDNSFGLKDILFLMLASIVLAKILDKFVDYYFRQISTWSNLLLVLLTLYFSLSIMLIFMFLSENKQML